MELVVWALRAAESAQSWGDWKQLLNWGLGLLLCSSEAFSKTLKRSSKQASRGNWGVKEGDLIHILDLTSVRFNHRWRSSTTRLAMDLTIACAVILVARRARSVALHSSLKAVGSGLD